MPSVYWGSGWGSDDVTFYVLRQCSLVELLFPGDDLLGWSDDIDCDVLTGSKGLG